MFKNKKYISLVLAVFMLISISANLFAEEDAVKVLKPIMNEEIKKLEDAEKTDEAIKAGDLELGEEIKPTNVGAGPTYTTTPNDFYYQNGLVMTFTDEALNRIKASGDVILDLPEFDPQGRAVTGVSNSAFSNVSDGMGLTNNFVVEVPASYREIQELAFFRLKVVNLVVTAKGLLDIKMGAFAGCSIEHASFSSSGGNINIGKYAFALSANENADVSAVEFNADNNGKINIADFAFYGGKEEDVGLLDADTMERIPLGKPNYSGYKYVGILSGVETIGKMAFFRNPIETLLFHSDIGVGAEDNDLKSIGDFAFAGINLKDSIVLKNKAALETIGVGAFYAASGKTPQAGNIEIQNNKSLKTISPYAFSNNAFTGDVIIKDNPALEIIDHSSFLNGDVLITSMGTGEDKELTNYFNVQEGVEAPYYKGNLVLENLPSLTKIGAQAFTHDGIIGKYERDGSGNYVLDGGKRVTRTFKLKESREKVCTNGFTGLTFKSLPKLQTIDEYAFMDNNFNSELDFNTNAPNLQNVLLSAFNRSGVNGTLTLNENLLNVSESAFFDAKLNNIDFTNAKALVNIEKLAFSGNPLTSPLLIKGLPNLELIGRSSFQFAGDKNTNGITISENPKLKKIDIQAFNAAVFYGDLIIKDNPLLEEIALGAFLNSASSRNAIYDIPFNSFKKDNTEYRGMNSLLIDNNASLKTIGNLALANHYFRGSLDLRKNPITTIGPTALAYNGFECIDLPPTVEAVEGMDSKKPNTNAFAVNNQNFKGASMSDKELRNLNIFVNKKDTPLKSTAPYYVINTSGSCAGDATITVKVLNEKGEQVTDLKGVTVKLNANDELDEEKTGDDVEFTQKSSLKKYKVFLDNVPKDYDATSIKDGVDVPKFVDNKAEVIIKLPKVKKDITVKYIDKTTGKPVKPEETIKDKPVGDTINIPVPNIKGYKEETGKKEIPHEVKPSDKDNVVTIYYVPDRNINITKIHDGDNEPMPCIKYGIYKKSDNSLIAIIVTDEKGKASYSLETMEAVYIKELGIDNKCNKCKKDGKPIPCPKKYDDYVPNEKVVDVPPNEPVDITYYGYEVMIQIPQAGTYGVLPYIMVSMFLLLLLVLYELKKRKEIFSI